MRSEILLKALADESRLKIISYLMSGPKFVEQIAKQLNIGVSTASFHLEKLKAAGLVRDERVQYYRSYSLVENALSVRICDLVSCEETTEFTLENEVIDEFFEKDRLKKLPVARMKREIVLKEIAKRIKRRSGYNDREMNVALAEYFDDFITLKKELLSFGLLIVKDGRYFVLESLKRSSTKKEK